MMKRILPWIVLFLMGCGLIHTPDDFPPPPPMTAIVEIPQVTVTTTIEPNLRPILTGDMQEAGTFFLLLKTSLMAGNDLGVAELIKYPIHVKLAGQVVVLNNQQEFLDHYEKIFDPGLIQTVSDIEDSDLTLMPNGVQIGDGELWFNYYCVDLACSDAHFLITQINK